MRRFFDEHGSLIPIHDLGDEEAACLAGLEVIIKNAKAGDGHTDEVHKFNLWDKTRALEALAKHFGLVRERLDVSGWDKLAAQLNHAPAMREVPGSGASPPLRIGSARSASAPRRIPAFGGTYWSTARRYVDIRRRRPRARIVTTPVASNVRLAGSGTAAAAA
jgi:hypothetical protein